MPESQNAEPHLLNPEEAGWCGGNVLDMYPALCYRYACDRHCFRYVSGTHSGPCVPWGDTIPDMYAGDTVLDM